MPYIIAGLGNPGEEYELTRHNTGRIMLDALAKAHEFPEFTDNTSIKALVSKGKVGDETVTLVKPNNFMNRSGASLTSFVKNEKQAEKLIVIYDDLDLPLGKIKLSFNKSAGGHRGVESIIKAVKTEAFIRIRVGISPVSPSGKIKKPKGEDAVDKFIIGEFKKSELGVIKKESKQVIELIEKILKDGYGKAVSSMGA